MEQIKQMPGESQEQFLTRVSSLPVVTAALGQLCSFYSRTKESNSLLRYTFETAESGAKIALDKAQPWAQPALTRLEKPSKYQRVFVLTDRAIIYHYDRYINLPRSQIFKLYLNTLINTIG